MQTEKNPSTAFIVILAEINLMFVTMIYVIVSGTISPFKLIPLTFFWFILITITGMIFRATLKSYIGILVPFFCLPAALAAGTFYADAYQLKNGKYARDVAVADVLEHADATVIYFRDGSLVKDCTGEYDDWDTESHNYNYAVPFVGEGWKRSEPVTVWVVCRNDPANCLAQTGIAMSSKRSRFAIDDAEKKCGLKSDAKALMVSWIGSPEQEIQDGEKYLKIITGSANALWIIVFAIQLFRIRREE